MKELSGQSRRAFVRLLGIGTAASTLGGRLLPEMLTVRADALGENGAPVLKIKLSDYPVLKQNGSVVRLGVNPVGGFPDFQPQGDFFPIFVTRDEGGDFHALNSLCSHSGCTVGPELLCFCHGSKYGFDGSVSNGPAFQALSPRNVEFDGDNTLTIDVADIFTFNVTTAIPSQNMGRLAFSFRAAQSIVYELNYRLQVRDPWGVVPFALTATGAVNQMTLTGDSQIKTIYVDRANAAGIYAVGMKVTAV